jgi:DNA ligase (NAD+)
MINMLQGILNNKNMIEIISSLKGLKLTTYIKVLDIMKTSKLYDLKCYLDDLYYNGNCTEIGVTDSHYDSLKKLLIKRGVKFTTVGAPLRDGDNKANLPYWLGSAVFMTPEDGDKIDRWFGKNKNKNRCITEKLDGISAMLVVTDTDKKLYTRGDGTIGADISHIIPYIVTIPQKLSPIIVRGELIIHKIVFNTKYKEDQVNPNPDKTYKSARNMVTGLVGSKTTRNGLNDINFIVYEIISNNEMPSQTNQLVTLSDMGFTVPQNQTLPHSDINTVTQLTSLHAKFKANSQFEIDGIIIHANSPYDRNTSGDPSYLFAYKVPDQENIKETRVIDVEWNVSKNGVITPVVIVEPVELKGATVDRITGSNASMIINRGIGPQAVVTVTRANDVIPYIPTVIKMCPPDKMKFPNIEYTWNDSKKNIIVSTPDEETTDEMMIKTLAAFFDKMSIKHVGEETIRKLYSAGYDNLFKIITAKQLDISKIDRFKDKSSSRIVENIKKGLQGVRISIFISATNVFGANMGSRRIESLLADIPELFSLSCSTIKKRRELRQRILEIEGFSDILTEIIIDRLDLAVQLIDTYSPYVSFTQSTRVDDSLVGKIFVMTGFRSKDLEKEITDRGGKVTTSVSKKTSGLIVSTKGSGSAKETTADGLGIPVYIREEFEKEYIHV